MNDVELMNIQMDHIQRHHCGGHNMELIQMALRDLKSHVITDVGRNGLIAIIALLPTLECHVVRVMMEAQEEHQAIIFNKMEDN